MHVINQKPAYFSHGPATIDRSINFLQTRQDILRIHTQKWSPPLSDTFLNDLAEKTTGYCGADIMVMCILLLERILSIRFKTASEKCSIFLVDLRKTAFKSSNKIEITIFYRLFVIKLYSKLKINQS